jgi:proline iminopeptidase
MRTSPCHHYSKLRALSDAVANFGGAGSNIQMNSNVVPNTLPLARRHVRRDGQRLAYTVVGPANGTPWVILHGGPGSGSQIGAACPWGAEPVRAIHIDQRGAGASRPRGAIRHNDTARLIADIEVIRNTLGIERWHVLGGSWGAALALAYAGHHPESAAGVVLRGLFLTSKQEVRRLFVTSRTRAPREWRRLLAAAGCTDPGRLLACCARRLRPGSPRPRQGRVALAWQAYEAALLAVGSRKPIRAPRRIDGLIAKYRIQAHYLQRDCWLGKHRLLALARHAAQAGVPMAAVHGRYDPVCPPSNLAELSQAVPHAKVIRVPAGHLSSEPPMAQGLRSAVAFLLAGSDR